MLSESQLGIEQISAKTGVMVEGIVGPSSSLISKTLSDASFRARFNLTIQHSPEEEKTSATKLKQLARSGDSLLLLGTRRNPSNVEIREEIILLDQPALPASNMKRKAPIVLTVLVSVIAVATFGGLPISVALR